MHTYTGLEAVEALACRVMGDAQGLRPVNEAGLPLYVFFGALLA